MKCIDCSSCKKGWFESKPNDYVCTGVKEPFVIPNVNSECTEYTTTTNSEDMVNVVRCKDCKYFRLWYGASSTCTYWTEWWDMKTDPDGYCYHGEKKNN